MSVSKIDSELLNDTLAKLAKALTENIFVDAEKAKVELKDVSTKGDWKSLKETVGAFLNTDGGYIICGVRERDKQYSFPGFNRDNENNITELRNGIFENDNGTKVDLTNNIFFDYFDLLDKEVAVIAVKALTEDKKYVKLNGRFLERVLTEDKEIPQAKLNIHREYKVELEYAKEITPVDSASISDLSLDKINRFVDLLNREISQETFKSSLVKAKPFLTNQHFLKGEHVTTLGMLVCGKLPFHFLENRVEVDCYYDTSSDIGKDKKMFRDDVISLMEDTFKYVWGHIKVARVIKDGGQRVPEYPEKLIREIINNALAHRDYTINSFITVTVEPEQYLEVKNPGRFKEKMLVKVPKDSIYRVIPGIPESKNPKLAGVLKVFDKIESQGRGMASLVNAALENLIDLPYYELKDDTIILRIPTGKLLDEEMTWLLDSYSTYFYSKIGAELNEEQKIVLAYYFKSERQNRRSRFTIALSESNNHFDAIDKLKSSGLIVEHPAGRDFAPVYVLEDELLQTDFRNQVAEIIGDGFRKYNETAKVILNILYRHSKFNNKSLKPVNIIPEAYFQENGKAIDPTKYDSYGRKIRKMTKELSEAKMGSILLRNEEGAYSFNFPKK